MFDPSQYVYLAVPSSVMEDYYEILNSCQGDTLDKIKRNYLKLVLQLHPDKQQQNGLENANDAGDMLNKYHYVNKAWKVLSDPELRKQYDASWKQRNTMQQWPIQEVVNFEEFDLCDNEGEYCYSCRCGGNLILTKTDALFQVDYVCCDICSLCIKVEYKSAPAPVDI